MSESTEKGSLTYVEENHFQNSCDQIGELWRLRSLCDVHLIVEDGDGKPTVSIAAHRVVLAANVPYFKAMFTSGLQESNQTEVTLKNVDEAGLKSIVSFIYSGKLEITEGNVQGLLSTASMLDLPAIVGACARFMTRHLSPTNCLGIKAFAYTFNVAGLPEAANNYAMQNFADVLKEEEFLHLSADEVEAFVSSNKINVTSEEDVYVAVTRWLEHDIEIRKEHAGRLYNHVRFPILDVSFLKGVVMQNPIIESHSEVKVMVKEAFEYHENPASVILFSNPKKTQPRSSVMGVICVVGGAGDAGESLMDVTFFNPHENQWNPGCKMLQHRSRLAIAMFKGELYAIGGADLTESLSSVEKYSPVTNSWSMIGALNTARRSCAAIVTRFGIYVLGGFSGSVFLHSVELYDPDLDEWTYQPPMQEARSDLCAVFFDQRIYAIGGTNSKTQLRSVERFDLINRKWETVADMYAPRANAGKINFSTCPMSCRKKISRMSGRHDFNSCRYTYPCCYYPIHVADLV